MDINEKHIVAIDLGTSKIALTVAKVNGEDACTAELIFAIQQE